MFDQSLLNRFSSRVNVPDNWEENINLCWNWVANKDRDGYGRISQGAKKQHKAHRVAWEIYFGPIPFDMLVLHKCDHPPCVNPYHLFLGTHKDNSEDMVNKGRTNPCIGSNSGRAILTEFDVLEILDNVKNKVFTSVKQIALHYNVSPMAISPIFDGKHWKHITLKYYTLLDLKYLKNQIDTRGVFYIDDIKDIRKRLTNGESVTSIANLYGVSYNAIGSIKHNISWQNVK